MDNLECLRRLLIVGWPIFVHKKNLCILGFCDPSCGHEDVVNPDFPSMLFTMAAALAIAERDNWPRRCPFRPLPKWLIILMEVLVALLIHNLLLRLIWVPFVTVLIATINHGIGVVLSEINELLEGNCDCFGKLGEWIDSEDGVYYTGAIIALFIFLRTFYCLYNDKLNQLYAKYFQCPPPPPPPCSSSLQAPRRMRTGPGRPRLYDSPQGQDYDPRDNADTAPQALRRSARIQNQSAHCQSSDFEY